MPDHPSVGQLLHTPVGPVVIIARSEQLQVVVTQNGSWPEQDLYRQPAPVDDPEALEAWLASSEWCTDTEPLQTATTVETIPCKTANLDCECIDCHASVHRTRGVSTALYHERQNDRCQCEKNGCPCLS